MRTGRLGAVLAALAIMAAGAPAPYSPVSATGTATKSALPAPSYRSRRAIQQMISGDAAYVPGGMTGRDWLIRRTKNFRRKGVGSRWRFTQRAR